MRFLFWFVGVFFFAHQVFAEMPSLRTRLVLATYRLEHPKTSGTGFVLCRCDADENRRQLLLVVAAHAFEKMDGDQATLVLRKRQSKDDWVATPIEIAIRQHGEPLWHKHPQYDVAVLRLTVSKDTDVDAVPLEALANADDWKAGTLEPGSIVRCVGFPHAEQFKPSAAGFPLTRLGCIASFPLGPYEKHGTFLVDYNVYEGDSGGAVYSDIGGAAKIIGLVHGQHFLDERYKLVYQEGMVRKRLEMAIVVNSQAILETIDGLSDNGAPD